MMTKPAFDMTLDLRTLIHVFTLLGAIIAGYIKFQGQVDNVVLQVGHISKQTTRMEHYLSSKDPDYWKKAHENGDNER